MNLQSILDISPPQIEHLTKSSSNRISNGHFDNNLFSFYPWIPSGVVKLELNTEGAFTGKNHVRFYPKEGETGKVSQRTRVLQVGDLYMLFFCARSVGAPSPLYVEFGRRLILINKESLQLDYSVFTFLFRARSTFSYLHLHVKGKKDVLIDVDTVSLHSFLQLQKAISLAG